MKGVLIVLTVIFALIAVGLWVGQGLGQWFLDRDTQALLERAQVAANAVDMRDYVAQLEKNMEKRGMTEGHAALIFKTPKNDMTLIFKTVVRINERLASIEKLPQSETTYQVALDDLRGTLRELNLETRGWFWARNWWWMIGSFVIAVIAFILGFIAYVTD